MTGFVIDKNKGSVQTKLIFMAVLLLQIILSLIVMWIFLASWCWKSHTECHMFNMFTKIFFYIWILEYIKKNIIFYTYIYCKYFWIDSH